MVSSIRVVLVLVALFGSVSSAAAQCLFVNTNSDPNTVAAFTVGASGALTAVAGSPFATGGSGAFNAAVGSAGVCVGKKRIYVTNPTSDNLSGFDVAPDCTLTPVPGSPFAAGSRVLGVEADPSGEFLYAANFLGDSISVFSIAADGSLTPIAGSPFATPSTPFDIEFDTSGDHFFVTHDFAGSVGAYATAADGSFSPVAGSPFAAGGFEHGLALNPSKSRLYAADFGPDTITGFSVGAGGVLAGLGGSPFAAGVEPIEVLVDPTDGFLYATNDNAENIAGFAIDGSGALTPLAGSPFASDATGPAGLAQDPAGSFLFVANGGFSGSADVSVFTRAGDGSIAPIAGSPFATGGTGDATGIAYLSLAAPDVYATKIAWGSFVPGGTVMYTVTINNMGDAAQPDNPGDEFRDVFPPVLALSSSKVVSGGGTTVANLGTNTVTWNGSIPAGGSIVLEIAAVLSAGVQPGQTISNEGEVFYDSNGSGTNDSMRGTEPPGGPAGPGAPTVFDVSQPSTEVPTTDLAARVFLLLLIVATPFLLRRRRRG